MSNEYFVKGMAKVTIYFSVIANSRAEAYQILAKGEEADIVDPEVHFEKLDSYSIINQFPED